MASKGNYPNIALVQVGELLSDTQIYPIYIKPY
jgi:hypothetical protein